MEDSTGLLITLSGFFGMMFLIGGVILTPIFGIIWAAVETAKAKKVFKVLTIISGIMLPLGVAGMVIAFFGAASALENVDPEEVDAFFDQLETALEEIDEEELEAALEEYYAE